MTTYRRATLAELGQVLDWAAAEGWNPGLDDATAFFAADTEGFFVAEGAGGDLQAAISVVNHTDAFAFLGLYIVRPASRGQGIGVGLWTHAMQHAGSRVVGLDGVEAQQDNYVRSGFSHAGATMRFTGDVTGDADPAVRAATPDDIAKLIGLEAGASGVAKPRYLRVWFGDTATRRTFVRTGPQGITGCCTIRACQTGAKIGPLVANSAEDAGGLIHHAATVFGGPVTLDVPETAVELVALFGQLGLTPGFRTARMYRGPSAASHHQNFAVTSLELG